MKNFIFKIKTHLGSLAAKGNHWLGKWPLTRLNLKEYLDLLEIKLSGITLNAGSGEQDYGIDANIITLDILAQSRPRIIGDLHEIPLRDESVNNILAICVFEHLRKPDAAAAEFFRILKKGGKLIVEVPFLNPIHAAPHDFYRFTSEGMKELLSERGFQVRSIYITQIPFYYHIWALWSRAKSVKFYPFRCLAILGVRLLAFISGVNRQKIGFLREGDGYSQFIVYAEKT